MLAAQPHFRHCEKLRYLAMGNMPPNFPRLAAVVAVGLILPVAAAAAETLCPMIYQPVCAAKDNIAKTFANRCLAESEGFNVMNTGRCGENGSRSKFKIKASSQAVGQSLPLSQYPLPPG